MRRPYSMTAAIALLLISASACSSVPAPVVTTGTTGVPVGTTDSSPSSEPPADNASPVAQIENFDPGNFAQSTTIDNKWMPMQPGTRFVYEGETIDDSGVSVPHRVVITITDLTKVVGGIRTVVSWDEDYSDGELAEAELAFFAQDNAGTVWRMGEYPEEYENGEFVRAPAWIHGFADAKAGIAMQAQPQLGTPSYAQGLGPAVGWTDRGQVDQVGQEVCVPADCYTDVLVIAETSASEPDAEQLKFWANSVGNVRVAWRGEGEKSKETLELTELIQLSPEVLAEARGQALELEKHAYQISKDVYANTPPLELPSGVSAPAVEVTAVNLSAGDTLGEGTTAGDVVVYASELPNNALSEFDVLDDPASPEGKLVATANTGGHLDPPPENDPHVTFKARVQSGVPYRCWIHMKVGAPKGESLANMLWVQVSDAIDAANTDVFMPDSGSYLTAQGPEQEGWSWVGCDLAGAELSKSLITFETTGEVTVRLQAGMEGVGFDQFLLSPVRFLEQPPSEAVVAK